MKKILKIVGWGLGVVMLVIAAGLGYLFLKYPDAGLVPTLTVQATPERLARGAYLANHVSVCIDCHSTRNWEHFSPPPMAGTEGKGGELFDESLGFPGTIYAHNMTPAALGSVNDGVVYRAITTGVDKNGKAMFPLMPYQHINLMSEEDILSIIAYIWTLKPIEDGPPLTTLKFPMNLEGCYVEASAKMRCPVKDRRRRLSRTSSDLTEAQALRHHLKRWLVLMM